MLSKVDATFQAMNASLIVVEVQIFRKIETPVLMQIAGHAKESTFLSYIGQHVNKDAYADAFMKVAATL